MILGWWWVILLGLLGWNISSTTRAPLTVVNSIEISSSTVWNSILYGLWAKVNPSKERGNDKWDLLVKMVGKEQHVSSCFNIFPKCWFGAVFVTADSKRYGHQRFSKHVYICIDLTHTDIMDSDVISLGYSLVANPNVTWGESLKFAKISRLYLGRGEEFGTS